jgi:DNA-binding transcriptional MerR regulator
LEKAPDAFRTISEVADEIDVPQHVLRFWESRFPQIRPMKRGGGRRYYRPDDVDLLRGVRHLLYGEGYTIRGVQRILRENGVGFVQTVWSASSELPPDEDDETLDEDEEVVEETIEARSETRAEPNLFAVAAPRAHEPMAPERAEPARTEERREPTIVPPMPAEQPSPPVQPSAAPPASASAPSDDEEPADDEEPSAAALDADGRRKLEAALDELTACRRILETALQSG